jgi:hypothetical protein
MLDEKRELASVSLAALLGLAAVKVLVHFLSNGTYGYVRDELYYLACADHLAWGYVDHPPLSIFILAATRKLLGDSIFAIRLPVVLAGAGSVFVTGLIARELGGGRFAQASAALACLGMTTPLALSSFFSMNAFDYLAWTTAALLVVRLIRTDKPASWLGFGLLVGLALLNKISIAFLGFGLVVGLLLTPERRLLGDRRAWIGGLMAFVIFLPHLIWQAANGFPTLEFIHNAQQYKIVAMSPLQYIGAQVLLTSPFVVPLWLLGLVGLLAAPSLRRYRALGFAYLAVLGLFLIQHAKAYYLAPAYPMLVAAGAVVLETLTRRRARWLRPATVVLLVLGGVLLAPLAMPILPPPSYVAYARRLGASAPAEERSRQGELPQIFADRFGWPDMVATIAQVYRSLPPAEQAEASIFAGNYGEAGAVDFFGRRYGLPRAISGHNSYWLWGPGSATGEVAIAVGIREEDLRQIFESVEPAATVVSPYAMPAENDLPVYVCRHMKVPPAEAWPRAKRFI